jgi:hypothetical protein
MALWLVMDHKSVAVFLIVVHPTRQAAPAWLAQDVGGGQLR